MYFLILFDKVKTIVTVLINNHFRLAFLLSILGIILFTVSSTDFTFDKVTAKFVTAFIFLAIITLYEKFYLRFNFDTAEKISENSLATAIYLGLTTLSIGLCIALA